MELVETKLYQFKIAKYKFKKNEKKIFFIDNFYKNLHRKKF